MKGATKKKNEMKRSRHRQYRTNYFISLYLQIKSFRFDYFVNNLFFHVYARAMHSAPFMGYFSFHFVSSSSCLAFLTFFLTHTHSNNGMYGLVCGFFHISIYMALGHLVPSLVQHWIICGFFLNNFFLNLSKS